MVYQKAFKALEKHGLDPEPTRQVLNAVEFFNSDRLAQVVALMMGANMNMADAIAFLLEYECA